MGAATPRRQRLQDQRTNKADVAVCYHRVYLGRNFATSHFSTDHDVCFISKSDKLDEKDFKVANVCFKRSPMRAWNPEIVQLRRQVRRTT